MNNSILRPWLELARISNLPTVWTNILAAWLLAGGKWDWKPLTWLLAGSSLIYTGGMFLNDAADVKFDFVHRKERPIPSGRISQAQAWIAGLVFLSGGFSMFVWGAEARIWLTGALIAAILIYDLYHKPWPGSVLIMGSCRTLLYLSAASAVTGSLDWQGNNEVIVKAMAMGTYVVGISLCARNEYLLNYLWLLCIPVMTRLFNAKMPHGSDLDVIVLWFLLLAWMGMLVTIISLSKNPAKSNTGKAVGMLLAGIVLADALAVSSVSPSTALAFAAMMPLLLFYQKKIAAT